MTDKMNSFVKGILLELCKPFPKVEAAISALVSSDGYMLQGSDGLYLIPKESE